MTTEKIAGPEGGGSAVLEREEIPFFDKYAAAARKKLNAVPEWEWWELRALSAGDVLIKGGIPNVGKKGRAKWKGTSTDELVVTAAEKEAVCAEYEIASGKCHQCAGSGKTLASAHANGTRTFRECSRCKGTGSAVSRDSVVEPSPAKTSTENR